MKTFDLYPRPESETEVYRAVYDSCDELGAVKKPAAESTVVLNNYGFAQQAQGDLLSAMESQEMVILRVHIEDEPVAVKVFIKSVEYDSDKDTLSLTALKPWMQEQE